MQITPHFEYEELVYTNHNQFKHENYERGKAFIDYMRLVCHYILEPVRLRYGVPVHVSSCFRCLSLNRYIGSKDTSQHLLAQAVDFEVKNTDCKKVFDYIRLKDCFKYGQLILEKNNSLEWIHCSLPTLQTNMQVLIFENGKYRRIN